jgi:thymidine kinase
VVAVDEAQFFDDLIPFVTAAADGRGQTVIVAGLDGDFARRPFGALLALVPHAETVTRLAASCAWCGADAAFSVRVKGGAAGETVVVGGAESYAPACRAHYHAAATLPPPPPPLGGAAVAAPSLGAGAEAAGRAGVGQ